VSGIFTNLNNLKFKAKRRSNAKLAAALRNQIPDASSVKATSRLEPILDAPMQP
jgi:hypothetical protein